MNDDVEKIGIYFRGIFIENRNGQIDLKNLGFDLKTRIEHDSYTLFSGIKISNLSPGSNLRKIKFDLDKDGNPINFQYPVYIYSFRIINSMYLFICLPNIKLFEFIFPNQKFIYSKFDLIKICSSFYQYKTPSNLSLSRSNYKLNYDSDESVSSISLFGQNNLQSSVIKEFLKLYPKPNHFENPFDEDPAILEPKSCRLNWVDNINKFSLNTDSSGNFSFYLSSIEQFKNFNLILSHAIKTDAFLNADISPFKRSDASLKKSE